MREPEEEVPPKKKPDEGVMYDEDGLSHSPAGGSCNVGGWGLDA